MHEPALNVELGVRRYPIYIAQGLLDDAGALLHGHIRHPRVIIVTDQNLVDAGHTERLCRSFDRAGHEAEVLVVSPGEGSKSFKSFENLLEDVLALGIERRTAMVALGGGVVGDLAGFVAASVLRGLDFFQIPTTLLAQVDSAVGGKTGINSAHGKNLIGAFHQPKAVLIDVDMLTSLPGRELRAGYAEIIKYGCIHDAAFFDWLELNGADLLAGDSELQILAIKRSLEIKAEIVAADEKETSGARALLNFGHTFAHAYEALAGYGNMLLHGEAVSLGMVKAADLSARLGLASPNDHDRLRKHLERLALPTSPRRVRNDGFAVDAMLAAMQRDKKVEAGQLHFVLWRGIGEAFTTGGIDVDTLRELLASDG